MKKIALSDHFTYGRLLRFTLPSIVMMIFTSIYGVVDGYFVSNYVGKTPFAAVNFIMPVLMILGAVGFMFGSGGSALIAKTLGEGKNKKARELFSLIVYVTIIGSIIITILSIIFLRPIAILLGAEGQMLEDCVLYGTIILFALPFYIIQFEFQSFFITAEKPELGLYMTVVSGVANMVLDWLFMAVFRWGLSGAAWATAISQTLGGIIPLVYFARPNMSLLGFTKAKFDGKALLKACTNGSSELMSNISMSVVGMLYNIQLLKYAGENGIFAPTTSPSASTKMPPNPHITIVPKPPSFLAPINTSLPLSCGCIIIPTVSSIFIILSNSLTRVASSFTPTTTPPTSLLCTGPTTFITRG